MQCRRSYQPYSVRSDELIYNSNQMFQMEKANRKRLGTLAELPVYSIPYPKIKKIAAQKIIYGDCKTSKSKI